MKTNNNGTQSVLTSLPTENFIPDCLKFAVTEMMDKKHSSALHLLGLALEYTCITAIETATGNKVTTRDISKLIKQARESHAGTAKALEEMEQEGFEIAIEIKQVKAEESAAVAFNKQIVELQRRICELSMELPMELWQ